MWHPATNTTKGVSERIADGLNADLYEIVPEEPYTDADLNWHDDNSQSTIEMNDSSSCPGINGAVEVMEQYEIVFIGYPIANTFGSHLITVQTFYKTHFKL